MKIIKNQIEGLLEIIPDVYQDDRGWFMEFTKRSNLSKAGIKHDFVQDNLSFSRKDVIRGLHYQRQPFGQAKLVTVISGSVLDVAVDLRKDSPTFLKHAVFHLDSGKRNMLYIPEGFAHGFRAITDAVFFYKCSSEYNAEADAGLRWNDPTIGIAWGVEFPSVSAKDAVLPLAEELLSKSFV
ncbi:MAG: dTDP-4-dehydrorhamnose 3,5-epimerase [Bacteroidetes bacterium]|nr:dTDP-4-dehydrorhamnose 3,5-epimerase [Bacteroidota bacterium]